MDQTVLEIENLTKSFDGVPVLKGITLKLLRGRVLGLAGENGAGKSTLAKCISHVHKPDSGKIVLDGSCYLVPQEFTLIPTLNVTENIFLGRELSTLGFLRKKEMIAKAASLIERIGGGLEPEKELSQLSVAEKQKLEIAKALYGETSLMIMDEPTTVLGRAETEKLFDIIRDFTSKGGAVLYISHKLDEVREICDDIAILRDGELIEICDAKKISSRELASKMVGRELSKIFPPKKMIANDAGDVLKIENLSSHSVVKDVSFSLKRGEIFGLAGLAGAGRTELAETIMAIRKKTDGKIFMNGNEVNFKTPHAAFANGISYLSEDRQGTALLTNEGVMENVTLGSLSKYLKGFLIDDAKRADATKKYIETFRIKCSDMHTPLKSLSGGNQQKAAIAKGLDTSPEIFIFDEPTRGVDVGARSEIYDFIHSLAESGVSCILISSDLEEVIGNCYRIGVMREGKLAGILSGDDATEEKIMYLATGTEK